MFIELTELSKTGETIGSFMINSNNISFIDTVYEGETSYKRVRTNEQVSFYISDKDYNKLKKLFINNNEGPNSM